MKHFYHHIVAIDSIHVALSELDLEPHEKEHLIIIAETNIHHRVIDAILSELANEDKKVFLALLVDDEHDHGKIWDFLHTKVEQSESKVKNTIDTLLHKMHEDIKRTHKKSKNE